jgi:hypothetical protein
LTQIYFFTEGNQDNKDGKKLRSLGYPAMRHSGQPGNAKRPLAPRDATSLSVLLLAFSGYLSPQVDEQVVLGI